MHHLTLRREGASESSQENQVTRDPAWPLPLLHVPPTLRKQVLFVVAVLLFCCLGLSPLLLPTSSAQLAQQQATVPPRPLGSLVFTSSGQLDPSSERGINDHITLNATFTQRPTHGLSAYAWLLADRTNGDLPPLLLGSLTFAGNTAHLSYQSPDHNNLLADYSRLLITLQPAHPQPSVPTTNSRAWLASGAIPNTPAPGDEHGYSLLDHLRHLAARDPTLASIGLGGGLAIWLYRNVGKVFEWSNAARDDWGGQAFDLLRRQVIRVLDYLDGSAFIWRDVPSGTPFLVDPHAGRLGLLTFTAAQTPPGYLAHISIHLAGLAHAPGATGTLQHEAGRLQDALDRIANELQQARSDAVAIIQMSQPALAGKQALTLLNDLVSHANTAYVGRLDPATGTQVDGTAWLVGQIQGLATITLFSYGRA